MAVLTWVVNGDSEDIMYCYYFTHLQYVVTVLSLITATFYFGTIRQLLVHVLIKVRMD